LLQSSIVQVNDPQGMDSPVNSRNHQIANIGTLSIVRLCQANAESIMTNEIAFSQLATLGLFTC